MILREGRERQEKIGEREDGMQGVKGESLRGEGRI